jgi:signal transduction histidine kinase/signal recognition particle receptor subunit beta
MSVVNLREKSIQAKVVYYGPPLGGKTTSLRHVHRVMDPDRRTRMISLNPDGDRTLFFDYLPFNLGRIGDFSLRIQGFTVPGQANYRLTRRFVLRGVDAVIFVADSSPGREEENLAGLRDLVENLASHGPATESVPVVLEYNKRDHPDAVSVEEMNDLYNSARWPHFETVATRGTGVFEAFAAAASSMVLGICSDYRIGDGQAVAAGMESTLLAILDASAPTSADGAKDGEATTGESGGQVVIVEQEGSGGAPDPEEMLERALSTNLRVAELLAEVQEARSELEARVGELSALYRLSGSAASSLDEDRVVATVVEGAAAALHTGHASLLLTGEEDGVLRERGVHGFLYDPLASAVAEEGLRDTLAVVLESTKPLRIGGGDPPGVLEALRHREPSIRAAVAAPVRLRSRTRGLLVAYFTGPGPEPGGTASRFLAALGASASVALENARLHGAVERMNRELEGRVEERTRELEAALADLRQLDQLKEDFLSSMYHELMTPLSGIRSSVEILRTYEDLDDRDRREFLRGIEAGADRLTQSLQDILDLSAFEAGQALVVPAPQVAGEMVQEALDRARPAFEAAGVRVGFRPRKGLPKVVCDPRWTGRALDHLLDNAAKFTPEGGEVDVTVEAGDGTVRFSVSDGGPGIPPGGRETIFLRFKQAGPILTDKPPGLGAGLPLARTILEAQGGTIGIEDGSGRGTVAWIELPAV